MTAPVPEIVYPECGVCGHYEGYCKPEGGACDAWVPENPNGKCGHVGRTVKAPPAPVVSRAAEYDAHFSEPGETQ